MTGTPLGTDWVTYHYDYQRSGSFPSTLVISSPTPKWKYNVDAAVYAEPLVYRGSVLVVTENDSVYSISIAAARPVWRTNLGTPEPRTSLPCGNINPVGITGTPAIDPATSTLYLVAMLKDQGYRLFALSTDSGSVRWSVPLNTTGFDYHIQQERGALALANGLVYIPFGGFYGDCGSYHGWVMSYPEAGTGSLGSYKVPSGREAGIWSTGGVEVEPSGSLLVSTGNGGSTTTFDYGESVIRLNPDLTVAGYFAPANWFSLNAIDEDVGSMSPVQFSNGAIFQAGKEGVGYLLNGARLGGIGGEVYSLHLCSGAYGAGAVEGSAAFIPCTDGLYKITVSPDSSTFKVAWSFTGLYSGPAILAYGGVWFVDVNTGAFYVLNETSGHMLLKDQLGDVVHFTTPSAGEGFVFVAATDTVYCYGPGGTVNS